MATIKYTGTSKSLNGRTFTVEVHDMDFAGSSTDIILGAGGFVIKWEGEGGDGPYVGNMFTSSCSIAILCSSDTILNYLLSLTSKQERKGYIVIKEGSTVIWGGRILSDLSGYVYEDKPYFQLTATDGLKTLQSIEYTAANFGSLLPTAGWYSLQVILMDIFERIYPTGNPFYQGLYKVWTFNQSIEATTQLGGSNRSSEIRINTLAFMLELDKPMTYWEVLKMICKTFGLRLIYADGSYHLWQWKSFDQFDAVAVSYFDPAGYIGNVTLDTTQLITPATTQRKWVNGPPQISFLSQLKESSIIYTAPNKIGPDKWLAPDNVPVWVAAPSVITPIYGGCIEIPYTGYGTVDMNGIAGSGGEKLKLQLDIDIDPALALKATVLYVSVTCTDAANPGTHKRLTNVDGTWQSYDPATFASKAATWVTPGGLGAEFYLLAVPGSGRNRFEILTPALPFASNNIAIYVHIGQTYSYKIYCTLTNMSNVIKSQSRVENLPNPLKFKGPGVATWSTINRVGTPGGPASYTFIAAGIPISGHSNKLYYFVDPANSLVSGNETLVTVKMVPRIVTDSAINTEKGYEYIAINAGDYSDTVDLGNSNIGDLINGRKQQAIQVWNGTAWVYSSNWIYGDAGETAKPILKKIAELLTTQRAIPFEIWQGAVMASVGSYVIKPHYTLVKPGKTFIFGGGTWTGDTDEIDGEWYVWLATEVNADVSVGADVTEVDRNMNNPVIGNNAGDFNMGAGGISNDMGAMKQTILEVREFARSQPYEERSVMAGAAPPTTDGAEGFMVFAPAGEVYKHDGADWALYLTNMNQAAGDTRYLKLAGGTMTGDITMSPETANTVAILDGSKKIKSSSVTSTELGYLGGATSNIQAQIDAVISGIQWKAAARVASTGNVSTSAPDVVIDGVTIVTGDRILLKNQTTASQNGIYVYDGVALTRSTDANTGTKIRQATVNIEEGTANADTRWMCTTNAPITINVTSLTFVNQGSTVYTASNGLTLVGNDFQVANGGITNTMLAGSIAYGKLSLTGAILNADLAGSIADGKLASSYIYADGSRALTANWAAGNFQVTVNSLLLGSAANTISGGAASAGNLILQATTNATIGYVGITNAPRATANYGLLSLGNGGFAGGGTNFTGSSSGTHLAINAIAGFGGNLADWQMAGVSIYRFAATGTMVILGASPAVRFTDSSVTMSRLTGNLFLSGAGTNNTTGQSVQFSGSTYNNTSGTSGIFGTASGISFSPASGTATFNPLSILYILNAAGANTATVNGIFLNATETSLNGMTHNLMNLQVGGVSKFKISNGGAVTMAASANSYVTNQRVLTRDTTGAALTEMTTDGAAGSGSGNRIAVPANCCMSIVMNVCCKQRASANSKQFLRQFRITNNAGATTIGSITVLGLDDGDVALSTASVTITANDTDDCLKIEATGVALTDLRWTAYVVSTETIYS